MIFHGDALTILRSQFADESVQCCVTSPPYWGLRDYGVEGQIGLEATPDEYVAKMVEVFREVRRVLKDDGTLWLNLGDSYSGSGKGPAGNLGSGADERNLWKVNGGAVSNNIPKGLKPKDLVGIPWRVAFALQADGWYLRSDIIWHKPNPMPESVTDRPTKAHEYLFLLSKNERYHYDAEVIAEKVNGTSSTGAYSPSTLCKKNTQEGGKLSSGLGLGWEKETRNKRSVWTVHTAPYAEAHFATFPPKLIEPCILAGCPSGGLVLDPFAGSGTTLMVAKQLGRRGVGIELNADYITMADTRTAQEGLAL